MFPSWESFTLTIWVSVSEMCPCIVQVCSGNAKAGMPAPKPHDFLTVEGSFIMNITAQKQNTDKAQADKTDQHSVSLYSHATHTQAWVIIVTATLCVYVNFSQLTVSKSLWIAYVKLLL